MYKKLFTLCAAMATGLAGVVATPSPAAAATFSGPITTALSGTCTSASNTLLQQLIVIGSSEFTTTDRVVTFPGGSTLAQDDFAIYLVDSAGIIIGAGGGGVEPSIALPANQFFLIAQMPLTAAGNVTAYMVDELDTFPDQSLGATFSNPGAAVKGSNSFNLVAIEPDCAFVAGDTTAPRISSVSRQTPSGSPTNADSLTWRIVFDETVQNVSSGDFTLAGPTGAAISTSGSGTTYDITASGGNLAGYNGTVTLGFAGGQNIQDASSNALSNTTPTGTNENTFDLDNAAPSFVTAVRQNPTAEDTSADTLTFRVTFSEAVAS
uniref:hypothetical protein n=1 Tax=Shimia sediminis TaxID=2497945 RepID=UPI0019800605